MKRRGSRLATPTVIGVKRGDGSLWLAPRLNILRTPRSDGRVSPPGPRARTPSTAAIVDASSEATIFDDHAHAIVSRHVKIDRARVAAEKYSTKWKNGAIAVGDACACGPIASP